jgi:transposase
MREHGIGTKAIAKALGVSVQAVKGLKQRTRDIIKTLKK